MDYITPKETSQKWGISERRIQKLCEENRIEGVIPISRAWAILKEAKKPRDGRLKRLVLLFRFSLENSCRVS